jgi:OOP family OmpA-OmpF porin
MCVNENKTALSLKYQDKTTPTVTTPVPVVAVQEPTPPVVKELDEPAFSYNKTILKATLSSKDKTPALEEFILKYCQTDTCTQDLSFEDTTKEAAWREDAIKIASFLKDKEIKDGAVSIGEHNFNIQGELQDSDQMDELNTLLTAFDPETFKVENLTTIAEKVVEEAPKPSIEDTQNEISQLLKTNPIFFEFDSSKITNKSQQTLDKIITLLKTIGNIPLTVEGHTDSGGRASYNKRLSQQRAKAVKDYLQKELKSQITAIGYGEERPISSNTKDKVNRRVEIHLKRGE